jgi:CBS domain-containing protein
MGAGMSLKAILAAKGNEVVSISSTADLATASKLLKKRQIGVLVVLGEDGRLVGILSERDIVHAMAESGDAVQHLPVSQVMTGKVVTCDVNDSISGVMERMTQGKFRHMPILDKDRLAGIVSNRDLLSWHLATTIREHMHQLEASFAELDLMRL